MARGINKAIIVGTLGQDPEIRYTSNGAAIANLSVATNEEWKDKNTGEKQERTEWHRVSIFGKLAEICGKYLHKGSQVYLEGRIQTRKWQDKNGADRYTTEIVAHEMQMLGSKGDSQQVQQRPQSQQAAIADRNQDAPLGEGPKPMSEFVDKLEDIPF